MEELVRKNREEDFFNGLSLGSLASPVNYSFRRDDLIDRSCQFKDFIYSDSF